MSLRRRQNRIGQGVRHRMQSALKKSVSNIQLFQKRWQQGFRDKYISIRIKDLIFVLSEGKMKIKLLSVINFHEAVEKDHKDILFQLGRMFIDGKCVPKNYAKAAKWFLKAAQHGNIDAMHKLGEMYRYGNGVPQDDHEAIKWFRMAGEKEENIDKIMNRIR